MATSRYEKPRVPSARDRRGPDPTANDQVMGIVCRA
jgi:hypothetical protein